MREQQKEYNAASADRHLVLRIFLNEIKGEPFSQIHVHPEIHALVHPCDACGRKYMAQIGYYKRAMANG